MPDLVAFVMATGLGVVSWTFEAIETALDVFLTVANTQGSNNELGWFRLAAKQLSSDPIFMGISAPCLETRIRIEVELFNLLRFAQIVQYEMGRELTEIDQREIAEVFVAQAPRTASLRYLQINMALFYGKRYPFRRQMAVISGLVGNNDLPSIQALSLDPQA